MPSREATLLGPRFEEALTFAARVHLTQTRKGSDVPYVGHLLGVCSLVIEDGGSEDEVIAALLHDAVEDCGGKPMLEQIRRRFGDEVARIVDGCTDADVTPKPPWRERKQRYLEHLGDADPSTRRVSAADKLYNARAILGDYLEIGDELWARFKEGEASQLWYYRALADTFIELAPDDRLARQLDETVRELERVVAG